MFHLDYITSWWTVNVHNNDNDENMHYPKSADQSTFQWTPPQPFFDLGNAKYVPEYSKRSLNSNNTLLKTNESKGRTYGLNHMSAWLKLNPISAVPILMINFSHFRMAYCILAPDPIFGMALFYDVSCWTHISDYHTVLNPFNFTCWQLTPLHYTEVLSWMSIFHLVVNKNDFSVQFESRTLKSDYVILHALFHWDHKCHYKKF